MRLALVIACLCCALLGACGQKGPLILPQEPAQQEPAEQTEAP